MGRFILIQQNTPTSKGGEMNAIFSYSVCEQTPAEIAELSL